MTIQLATPSVAELPAVVDALRSWQVEDAPLQLHPGDLGWSWRFGAEATAAALRTWSQDDRILAIGFLDGDDVLRFTTAPDARADAALAEQVVLDITDSANGVLPAGEVSFEAPSGALIRDVLGAHGWTLGESWAPLHRHLGEPVELPDLRFEVVREEHAADRVAVQRASFPKSTFTVGKWQTMAAGLPYSDARCLVAFDTHDTVVAAITVWSAGLDKPGLIEPLGVMPEFHGHGYGRAMTLAGAAALRELGSSSAIVCTETSNVGAVATYRSAGFASLPERFDLTRA